MRWDFSIWQRAEDRQTEALAAAQKYRRLHEIAVSREVRPERGLNLPRLRTKLGGRLRRWIEGAATFFSLLLIVLASNQEREA